MSNINTSGIKTNYPVPGVNNNTQGFRDNFTSIANNLDTAKTELAELQTKVVLKEPLTGYSLNNDMANTAISNCLTRTFRASTYDLGGALSGDVYIDITKGDVQYGSIAGDVHLHFTNWTPTGTRGNVKLKLAISNPESTIRFDNTTVDASGNITAGVKGSGVLLENFVDPQDNYATALGSAYQYKNRVTIPNGVSEVNYEIYSDDCGQTFEIVPIIRNLVTSHIQVRTPTASGALGDVQGQICTSGANLYVCVRSYASPVTLTVTGVTGDGSHATFTFGEQIITPFPVSSSVTISGVSPSGYNGTFDVVDCTETSVTVNSSVQTAYVSGGSIHSNQPTIWGYLPLTAVS